MLILNNNNINNKTPTAIQRCGPRAHTTPKSMA